MKNTSEDHQEECHGRNAKEQQQPHTEATDARFPKLQDVRLCRFVDAHRPLIVHSTGSNAARHFCGSGSTSIGLLFSVELADGVKGVERTDCLANQL